MFSDLRVRLLFWYLLITEAILLILSAIIFQGFRANIYRQLDEELWRFAYLVAPTLSRIQTQEELPFALSDTKVSDPNIEWFDKKGQKMATKGDLSSLESPKPGFHTFKNDFDKVRSFTLLITINPEGVSEPYPLGYIRVSQSTKLIDATLRQLLWQLTGIIPISLILVGFNGWWLTRKATEPAENSFMLLKQFSADVSHELRSPLTAIKTSLDIIRNHPERIHEKDIRKIGAIASATSQMIHLTEDLLFLVRNESQSVGDHHQWEIVSLNQLLEDLVELLDINAQEKGIQLQFYQGTNVSFLGDQNQLNRLFSNLINNAIQYTPEGGNVTVSLTRNHRSICIMVKDNGIGIAPENLSKVFNRFWRADKARSQRENGTGLGMSIAQAITVRHGGKISLKSELGKGSCFEVILPTSF